jgi:hypothetical protein
MSLSSIEDRETALNCLARPTGLASDLSSAGHWVRAYVPRVLRGLVVKVLRKRLRRPAKFQQGLSNDSVRRQHAVQAFGERPDGLAIWSTGDRTRAHQ